MNIKRYCAPSVEAALAQVRHEMGRDAVILSTRDLDLAGGGTEYEVVAACERATIGPPAETHHLPRGTLAGTSCTGSLRSDPLRLLAPAGLRSTARETMRSGRGAAPRRGLPHPPGAGVSTASAVADLQTHLLDQEVDPRLAAELARHAAAGPDPWRRLAGVLERLMPAAPAAALPPLTTVIGSTGVGKTTTLAKLAANAADAGQPVALLTCDTWRVAAVEQLAVFADLIEAPIAVAYTPDEFARAARDFAAAGRTVLVDTPGRGPRDSAGLETLCAFLGALPAGATRLVVPATLRAGDVPALLEAWLPLGVNGLILTKLDETTTFGPLLTLLARAQQPLFHLTFGQNVPDDVAAAADVNLPRLILDGVCDVRSGRKTA